MTGFRTVYVTSQCRCSYKNNYLVVRKEDQTLVHLSEISMILVESTAVYLSSFLLARLAEERIPVVFCDTRHNPVGQYMPLDGAFDSAGRLFEQLEWEPEIRGELWRCIVRSKILNQRANLVMTGHREEAGLLASYAESVAWDDATNREGFAAKVYFNALFGKSFSRSQDNCVNAILNYGYAVLLAWFNREIAARGYVGRIGIHHRGELNRFNLGCDFMEPFRPLIDRFAIENPARELDTSTKAEILDLFNGIHVTDTGEYRLSSLIGMSVRANVGILAERLDMSGFLEFAL